MLCSPLLPVSSSHSSPEGLAGVPVTAFLRSVRRKGLSPTHYRHRCIVCLAMADLNSPRTFQDTYVTMSLARNPCLGLPLQEVRQEPEACFHVALRSKQQLPKPWLETPSYS